MKKIKVENKIKLKKISAKGLKLVAMESPSIDLMDKVLLCFIDNSMLYFENN